MTRTDIYIQGFYHYVILRFHYKSASNGVNKGYDKLNKNKSSLSSALFEMAHFLNNLRQYDTINFLNFILHPLIS